MTKTTPHILPPTQDNMTRAADLIQAGKLVAFPTETVYGLGADATNDKAIASIYEAKGRPQFNPLIIHVSSTDQLHDYVKWSDQAQALADKYWPGPLTMVLPRKENSPISLLASAGLNTIAVRCPNHVVARELIENSGCPIAAPSANASGTLSPTEAQHVAYSLGQNVDLILDGGSSKVGLESTVLSLAHGIPTILRHGGITHEDLNTHLPEVRQSLHDNDAPQSPGMMLSHYAPSLPVRLNATSAGPSEAFLGFGDNKEAHLNLSPSSNLIEAAANLFTMLRELDKPDLTGIAIMPIPKEGLGAAINDRLNRAAAARG